MAALHLSQDPSIVVDRLLAQLTLEEKCTLLSGKNMWETANIPRLGIKSLKTTDGPAGVRGAKWTDGSHTTYIPCGISLGATFDPALIRKVGSILGKETRAKQSHVLLAPTMNISRSPFGGRNFENFGEDPYLTGTMASAYIRGVQDQGVGACMKHFVANDMETRRFNMDQAIDERTLREIYLRPFEMALEVEPWTAMISYPKVNGEHVDMSEKIVKRILREEWGYDKLAMSDWGGLNDTVRSIRATTDLEMPGPPIRYGNALFAAVSAGEVSEETHIDPSVRRLLRLLQQPRLLETEVSDSENNSKANAARKINEDEQQLDGPESRKIARDAAAAGIVLLKNTKNLLPLVPQKIRKVAIIGPNAQKPTHGGTGSAIVNPYYITNPLESISQHIKYHNQGVEIVHERGIFTHLQPPLIGSVLTAPNTGEKGFQVDFYAGSELQGEKAATTNWQDSLVYLMSDGDVPHGLQRESLSYRATGILRPTTTGTYQFSLSSTGKAKLFINDELLIDNSNWTQISGNFMNCGSIEVFADMDLVAGQEYIVRVDNVVVPPPIVPHDNTLFHKVSGVRVGLLLREDEEAMYKAAIEAAKSADVAIVVVGHNNDTEREGSDRTSLQLPGRTNDFVSDVCDANSKTIVVTQSACAIAMPWADKAQAIVHAWYQGQENGNALADVLFGVVNPSGKLPLTFPQRIEDHGSFKYYPDAATDKVEYGEGILVGYRWLDAHAIKPLWPFGYGLSYTTFQNSDVKVKGQVTAAGDEKTVVEVLVTNTGPVEGAEVVQLYTSPSQALKDAGLQWAPKALAGFQKIHLVPGESARVEIQIDRTAFRWYDDVSGKWRVDPGRYKCFVGTSSRDIASEVEISVL